jgi:hypothetical protein
MPQIPRIGERVHLSGANVIIPDDSAPDEFPHFPGERKHRRLVTGETLQGTVASVTWCINNDTIDWQQSVDFRVEIELADIKVKS